MLKNYLKTAARNLARHKFYSFINILGLATGLACTLVILLYVHHELSYDKHHSKAGRIYRVHGQIKFGDKFFDLGTTPAPMAAALAADYPEVEAVVRLKEQGRYLVKVNDQTFREEGVGLADSSIFSVFDIPLVMGTKEALYKPNTIVIDETTARKYFGDENPMGKRLLLDNKEDVEVTGVFADMPPTGHFRYNLIVNMGIDRWSHDTNWLSNNFYTYVLLRQGSSAAEFAAKFPGMVKKYTGPQVDQFLNLSMDDFEASGNYIRYSLMPLLDIHLNSHTEYELNPNGNILYVYIFTGIALLILGLAAINFMNLATARSAGRAKEVGVRKVLGSVRGNLIYQFLAESILISSIAMIIAVIAAQLMLPFFNQLADTTLVMPFSSPYFYLTLLLGVLTIGFLAGIYPAFFLSAFNPATVLKGKLSLGIKSGWLRSSLVVFQFVISTVLIIGTLVIHQQLKYIQTKNLGFDKNQVILIEDAYALGDQVQTFKQQIKQLAGVVNASVSGYLPVGSNRSDNMFWLEGKNPDEESMVSTQQWRVDYDYIATLGMELLAGRNFDEQNAADSSSVIINEAAVKAYDLTDPLGAHIVTWADVPDDNGNAPLEVLTVIGVVKDFHFESMKENIKPLMLFLGKSSYFLSVRVGAQEVQPVLTRLKAEWDELANGQPFSYKFLDQAFDEMYRSETRVGNLFSVFAVLAIFIACLGLFGLASFTAQQRTKEIGIRKVMGATVGGIVVLLSKEFGRLVFIALLIAIPLAWYGMQQWLQDYEFRIELRPWIFVLAAVVTFMVAWLTMSYQSIKAARTSPANSLRDE